MRENSKRYYAEHKEEIAEKSKQRRRAKLDAMTAEERAEYNRKQSEYQNAYRKAHPLQAALYAKRTWERKLERLMGDAEA
jgi:hypothetical protein